MRPSGTAIALIALALPCARRGQRAVDGPPSLRVPSRRRLLRRSQSGSAGGARVSSHLGMPLVAAGLELRQLWHDALVVVMRTAFD